MLKRSLHVGCFISIVSAVTSSHAQNASGFEQYVPQGWKQLSQTSGDLNADGRPDAVLVLEKNDPKNRKPNDGLGTQELNLNPRRLIILSGGPQGYVQLLSTDKFLPTENDADSPCLADPLEDGGISISKGVLRIKLNYWASCGGWSTSTDEYIFRQEKGRLHLIGRDYHEFMRNSGDATDYSLNYLSGKIKITKGLNEFEKSNPTVQWKAIKNNNPRYLDTMPAASPLEEQ